MEFLKALFYGIIEGITEWLPVSSTGHIILLKEFLPLNVSDNFFNVFEVVIQLGAILAVVFLFWDTLWPFSKNEKNYIKKDTLNMWFKILVSCLPAAIIGIMFDDFFEAKFYNATSVSLALIVVGLIFVLIELFNNKESKIKDIKDITYKTAFIIGIFQVLAAIFPGVSRSGATIIGALLIGVSRPIAAEFTFFLAVPVMAGASLLKLVKYGLVFNSVEIMILLIGTISAFIVSMFAIKLLISYVKKHDFKIFGYYRIILGIIILLLLK